MDEDQKRNNLQKLEALAEKLGFTVEISEWMGSPGGGLNRHWRRCPSGEDDSSDDVANY